MPLRAAYAGSAETPAQTTEQIAAALEAFLAEHRRAVVLEDGKVLFDMREAKYRLATEHGRCTLHLWSEERNLVRRVSATVDARNGVLRLSTHRFGQTKPQTLELVADRDRRTPSTREATRVKYLRVLERVLVRSVSGAEGGWVSHGDGSGEELWAGVCAGVAGAGAEGVGGDWGERGGDAGYGRWDSDAGDFVAASLPRVGRWAAGVSGAEGDCAAGDGDADGFADGVAESRRRRSGSLWELDQKTEELEQRDAADHGNLTTRLIHASE